MCLYVCLLSETTIKAVRDTETRDYIAIFYTTEILYEIFKIWLHLMLSID